MPERPMVLMTRMTGEAIVNSEALAAGASSPPTASSTAASAADTSVACDWPARCPCGWAAPSSDARAAAPSDQRSVRRGREMRASVISANSTQPIASAQYPHSCCSNCSEEDAKTKKE